MAEITNRGCKDILFPRMIWAIASSIFVQFIFMSCVILITNLSLTSPLSWLKDTWDMITCFQMWSYFMVLAGVIIFQGIVCSKNYLKSPSFTDTRFSIFCSLFTPHNFMIGCIYIVIGAVLVWLHLSLEDGNYSYLKKPCKKIDGSCLVEEYLFLQIGGIWTGFYYFTKTNIFGFKNLQFSIIPELKYCQVKRGINNVLPTAMTSALLPSIYYTVFYYFCGQYIRKITTTMLFINFEDESLDQLSKLINISLIFHTWLYATLFALTMNSMHLLFQAHLTEWMPFEVGQNIYNNNCPSITLPEALSMNSVPIIQHLGYLDLFNIAQKDKQRRAQLFTLSQPGGHPYNWNGIIEKCVELLKKYSDDINDICSGKQDVNNTIVTNSVASVNIVDKQFSYNMRSLTTQASSIASTISESDIVNSTPTIGKFIGDLLSTTKQNIITYLLSKPIIFYFFGTQNNSKIQNLLANGQPIIWATEAISSLVVCSIEEDQYGIAQKDLPRIVELLLSLKQSLDNLHKMNLLMRKTSYDDKKKGQMLLSLRSATKRSIYKITMAFKSYINDLGFEQNIKDQLQNFINCRE